MQPCHFLAINKLTCHVRPIETTSLALQVNAHLLTRLYLVGDTPTLADLCLYAALHRALVSHDSLSDRHDTHQYFPVQSKRHYVKIAVKHSLMPGLLPAMWLKVVCFGC